MLVQIQSWAPIEKARLHAGLFLWATGFEEVACSFGKRATTCTETVSFKSSLANQVTSAKAPHVVHLESHKICYD